MINAISSKAIYFIVALSIILRFYHLGSNPPSLNWDETAHGYNAYSILKTGKDEYGTSFPLYFRSFDDYKPPLYTYLVVPSVALFGLSDYAVRFPSAFIAIFSVFFTYLLILELFKNKKIALLAAFFLAVSPWHLQFSRVAFETNSAIFFSVFGVWAFLKGINASGVKMTTWFSATAIAFGLNLYMYHNARVFAPMISLVLAGLFIKKLLPDKKHLVVPILIATIFIIFLIPIATSISGQLRFVGTSVFGDKSPLYESSELLLDDHETGQGFIGNVLHNRRLVYIPIITQNYYSHFNPGFLFFTADMERHHAPQMGLLYLCELPFILIGVYILTAGSFALQSKIIVFAWFLLAPVASSVTWGTPHSLRSEILLPTFQLFSALGVYTFIKNFKISKIVAFAILVAFSLNFFFYLHQYHIHMSYEFSKSWLFGRKEAAMFTESVKNQYDQIVVSTKLEQPHEFWLYYLKYDPAKYQAEGGTVSGGFLEDRNKFDKYRFRPLNTVNSNGTKSLYVGLPEEMPAGENVLKTINYINGETAIKIWE